MCMTFGECVSAIFYLVGFTSEDFSFLSLPFYVLIIALIDYFVNIFFNLLQVLLRETLHQERKELPLR